jgi:hypothetical protein
MALLALILKLLNSIFESFLDVSHIGISGAESAAVVSHFNFDRLQAIFNLAEPAFHFRHIGFEPAEPVIDRLKLRLENSGKGI